VNTLFHEFGHALHSLLSQVRYRGSGNVAIDFVEMPSQVMENWAFEPELLRSYARHYKTGEPIPQALIERLQAAEKFGQGFATVEYLAAALLDMDWHSLTDTQPRDVAAFEKASLAKWGLIPEILPRYRTPYFNHAATDYSAGYYSYIWSAVLDSDVFRAFKDTGDLAHPATGKAFRLLLSKEGSEDPAALFRAFRGRDPRVEALLEKRGLK
jgi:peptidyl-dipeptidase Dcp